MEMETFLEDIAAFGGKELLDDVLAEFRLGWQREKVMTEMEMLDRAEVSTTRTSGAVDGIGRITLDVPATSHAFWLQWGRKRGVRNIWKDPQFRKDYGRDNPGAVVKYKSLKPRVGYDGKVGMQFPVPGSRLPEIVVAGKYAPLRHQPGTGNPEPGTPTKEAA